MESGKQGLKLTFVCNHVPARNVFYLTATLQGGEARVVTECRLSENMMLSEEQAASFQIWLRTVSEQMDLFPTQGDEVLS